MRSRQRVGSAAIGIGGAVLSRTPIGRMVTAAVVARRVWKDPAVQKVRSRIQKQVVKARARAGKDAAKR